MIHFSQIATFIVNYLRQEDVDDVYQNSDPAEISSDWIFSPTLRKWKVFFFLGWNLQEFMSVAVNSATVQRNKNVNNIFGYKKEGKSQKFTRQNYKHRSIQIHWDVFH